MALFLLRPYSKESSWNRCHKMVSETLGITVFMKDDIYLQFHTDFIPAFMFKFYVHLYACFNIIM